MRTNTFTILNLKFIIPIWSYFFLAFCVFCSIMTNLKPLVFIAAYLSIIVFHELGHAFFAKIFNYKIDAIVITPFMGFCFFEAPKYSIEEEIIALGGVAFQLAIALIAVITYFIGLHLITDWLLDIIKYVFIGLNIFTIIINVIPIYPLDGSIIWRRIKISNMSFLFNKTKLKQPKKNVDINKLLKDIGEKMENHSK